MTNRKAHPRARSKLDDPQRVGHEEEYVLLTTLLDEQKTHVDSLVDEQLNNLLAARLNQHTFEAKLRLV